MINEITDVKCKPSSYEKWKTYLDDLGWAYSDKRNEYVKQYSWFIVTSDLVDVLANQLKGKRVADMGCGGGYLLWCLKEKGVDIVGYDIFDDKYDKRETFVPRDTIIQVNYTTVDLSGFDVIICTWPCYGSPNARKLLKNLIPGQQLYYQGEGTGGCTADDAFHYQLDKQLLKEELTLELNEVQPRWPGMHDRWIVVTKYRK